MGCYYIASAGGDMVQQADRAVYTRSQSMEQIEGKSDVWHGMDIRLNASRTWPRLRWTALGCCWSSWSRAARRVIRPAEHWRL
jgi:hypothetical protein